MEDIWERLDAMRNGRTPVQQGSNISPNLQQRLDNMRKGVSTAATRTSSGNTTTVGRDDLGAPQTYTSVGGDAHIAPKTSQQTTNTKPLTGFAAGVQANNAGYKALAQKNVDKILNEPEQPLTGFAAGVQANNNGYRQLAEKPSFGNYVGRKFVGGAAESIEGTANAAGYWYQGMVKSGELQHNNALQGAAASTKNPYAKAAMESHIDEYGIDAQQAEDITQRPTKAIANFGDNYVAKTEEKFADADFGKVGNLIGDVAQGAGGMLAKFPANFVPGLGSLITFASAYGNAKQSAQKQGADESSASLYALGTATVELATEKMLGFTDFAGKGALDDIAKEYIAKLAKSEAGKTALNTILGAVGEGAEEFIAELGQSYINKLTIGTDTRNWKELNKDAWYDALVGGITALLFDTADIIGGGNGILPTAEDIESVTTQAATETVSSIARGDSVTLREMVAESENARNERLKSASIKITAAQKGSGEQFDKSMLNGVRKQDAGKYLAPILRKLGIFTKYRNPALDVSFEYSGNALRRSAAHQEIEGGSEYSDFALVNANLKELCENAYPAEAHIDEKPPTSDGHVQAAATLFSVLQDGGRLIPVKMTVKFYDHQDPTLHIVIAGAQTENKSANVNAVATQISGQHIADGTLTSMSVSDFLGVVNGSEQFTKRMPNISVKSSNEQYPLLYTEYLKSKGQLPTNRMLYTEHLLKQAEKSGDIYTQRILQSEIEKARKNFGKSEAEASTPMSTIYADYMREHNMPDDYEAEMENGDSFEELNADLENDANSDTINTEDIVIGKSLGAKAKNYDIMDFETGEIYHFTEGTRIQNAEVFAGKGTNDEYRNAYKMARKYGGNISNWQHVKGFGWVSTPDGDGYAEVHWSQCEGIGKHEFFIKRWIDR